MAIGCSVGVGEDVTLGVWLAVGDGWFVGAAVAVGVVSAMDARDDPAARIAAVGSGRLRELGASVQPPSKTANNRTRHKTLGKG